MAKAAAKGAAAKGATALPAGEKAKAVKPKSDVPAVKKKAAKPVAPAYIPLSRFSANITWTTRNTLKAWIIDHRILPDSMLRVEKKEQRDRYFVSEAAKPWLEANVRPLLKKGATIRPLFKSF